VGVRKAGPRRIGAYGGASTENGGRSLHENWSSVSVCRSTERGDNSPPAPTDAAAAAAASDNQRNSVALYRDMN